MMYTQQCLQCFSTSPCTVSCRQGNSYVPMDASDCYVFNSIAIAILFKDSYMFVNAQQHAYVDTYVHIYAHVTNHKL